MGQKVNPIGFRLGVNRTWDSRWFADGADYARLLHQDIKVRKWLKARLKQAGVSRVIIERPHRKCRVTIYAARPGVIIGKKGADIEKLRKDLAAITEGEVFLNIVEVRKPETDAQLIAESIAQQLERRIAFRRAMKRSLQSAMRLGAKGVRINVSGRLGGAEIARMEWYREGRVPLHTLRADIDYGFTEATTTYGIIGVKVWVFKGEVLEHDPMAQDKRWALEATGPRPVKATGATATAIVATATAAGSQPVVRRASGVKVLQIMLQPKKTKFRKQFKGRIHGVAKGGFRAQLRRVSA